MSLAHFLYYGVDIPIAACLSIMYLFARHNLIYYAA